MTMDGNKLWMDAPAKLNLRLRVLGRRADGFHEVETLMVPLPGLEDRVEVEDAPEFLFECDGDGVPADESNLAVRALRMFERVWGGEIKVRLRLEKRVPHGAGLGGGSSDAAAVLRLLARRSGGVGDRELQEMAAELGSDVTFFLHDGPAWCRGRGERIERASGVVAVPVVLLKPWFGVATPDAYGRWRDAVPLDGVDHAPQASAAGELVNDLERPVFAKHLFLAELREWLRGRAEVEAALMSGSGSTVFGVLRDEAAAQGVIAAAREELDPGLWGWGGWTGALNSQHPTSNIEGRT